MTNKKKYLHKFIPTQAKGEDSEFKGEIILRVPSLDEKYYFTDEMDLDFDELMDDSNTATPGAKKLAQKQNASRKVKRMLKPLGRCIAMIGDYVERVDLVHVDSGQKFSDFEEMKHYDVCNAVILELAGLFMRGFSPSKNL